jgi:UDP-N-acetyl-D-glucosamine dehydrogenase
MRLLEKRGADLVYHDDFVPELADFGLRSESLDDALAGSDCAVIVTAHPGLDVAKVVEEAPIVVDFRGVTRGLDVPDVVRL